MAVHARLKNEFTEDEKCHNLSSVECIDKQSAPEGQKNKWEKKAEA